jgi:hypothetical protein
MGRFAGTRPGDFWAHLLADVVVRLAYFVGTALLLIFGTRRSAVIIGESREALAVVLALSALAALFGPYVHRKAFNLGRGSLSEVRDKSRRDR